MSKAKSNKEERILIMNKQLIGRAQWLTLIIPALWEVKVGGSPEVESLRPTWPTWQNPISTKNTKKSARHLPVIPATREAEAGELPQEAEVAVS